jgi:hypothetical protein
MEAEIIRGSIDAGLLTKADRIFPNDNEGIFVELLQNARRAGAKTVRVTIEAVNELSDQCAVEVHDDGCGMDQLQGLVTLGKTGWDASTKATEDPAGMGFYSLCLSGEVEVASGYRSVIITRDVFLGKEQARVQSGTEFVAGTRLRFVRCSGKQTLSAALAKVTEFFPIEVCLDENILPQHDFLEGAIYREVIDGVEVGFSTLFKHRMSHYHDLNWNFYGLTIHHPFPGISGIVRPKEISPLTLEARFNVLETGRITLKLPDRSSVVQDDFLKQFERKARAAAYRCFQKEPCHALSFRNWREASELGVALPEAVCQLTTWSAPMADDAVDPPFGYENTYILSDLTRAMVVDEDLPYAHTLQGALHCGATVDHDLYHERPEYSGYSWYDALPRLTDVELTVDGIAWEYCPSFTPQNRPSEIHLSVNVRELGQKDRVVRLSAYFHIDTQELYELSFVAVKASPWDNEELAGPFDLQDFILWATFRASEDLESDSWQTQYDYHQDRIQEELNEYFRGPRANLIVLLRKLSAEANGLASRLGVTEITLQRPEANTRDWNIKLLGANGPIE